MKPAELFLCLNWHLMVMVFGACSVDVPSLLQGFRVPVGSENSPATPPHPIAREPFTHLQGSLMRPRFQICWCAGSQELRLLTLQPRGQGLK